MPLTGWSGTSANSKPRIASRPTTRTQSAIKRILPAFGGQHSAVGMRDDLRTEPAEDDGAEMVVGMMMGQHEPLDRPAGHRPNRPNELLRLTRTCHGIDHHDPRVGHDESGIGTALGPATGVSQHGIDSGRQPAENRRRRYRSPARSRHRTGENQADDNIRGYNAGTGAE